MLIFSFLNFGDRDLWIIGWPQTHNVAETGHHFLPLLHKCWYYRWNTYPPLVPRILESEDTSQILLSCAFPAFRLPTVGRLFYILIMLLQTRSFVAAYLNQMFHKTTLPPQVGALHSRMCSVLFDFFKKSAGCAVLSISQRPWGAASIPPPYLYRKIISQPTSKSPDRYLRALPPWFCSHWISQMCESGLLWSRWCLILSWPGFL